MTQSKRIITKLSHAALAAYGIAVPVVYLSGAESTFQAGILGILALWALSPATGLLWLVARAGSDAAAARNAFAGVLLICGYGLYVYAHGFYFYPNPQSGIAAIFMPLLQWLVVLLMVLWRLRFEIS
jgi:hypothetical protein